jgi:hypothetical protein
MKMIQIIFLIKIKKLILNREVLNYLNILKIVYKANNNRMKILEIFNFNQKK